MTEKYNTKCAGVRRLMKEAMELREPTEMYHAQPLEDNLFEWHFTIRGTLGSDFEGGIYHGRIIFPADYPMKPPNLILLTPNGRFELNKKICLSISGYHPETWLPSWSIRTALLALIGFLPTPAGGALGSLEYPPAERKRLAKLSVDWTCKECGRLMKNVLLPITEDGQLKQSEEAKKLASQLKFQDESVVKQEAADAAKATTGASSISEAPASAETPEHAVSTESEVQSESIAAPVAEETTGNSSVPEVSEPEPFTINHQPVRRLESSSFDYSLLFTIPLALFCVIVFITLAARRFLIDNGVSPHERSEL